MWALIGVGVMWLAIEVLIGFCCAVSFYLWAYEVGRIQGVKLLRAPFRRFVPFWFEHIGYRNDGSEKISGPGGYWRGIGDNHACPKIETEHPKGAA